MHVILPGRAGSGVHLFAHLLPCVIACPAPHHNTPLEVLPMLVYAAPEDMPERPENAEEVLLLASRLVYEATVTAFYATTSDGMPADPQVRDLFRRATVAQAKHWADLDIDPTMGAIGATSEKRVSTKSIGSASVSYDFRAAQDNVAARIESLNTLCATAMAILAPLRRGPVIVHG